MVAIEQLVLNLLHREKRETALEILAHRKDALPKLAPTLWYSFGTIAILLQEITSIYKKLSPPTLTQRESNRVCNAIVLLKFVASHPETKTHFVNARLHLYLFPFLNLENKAQPFQLLQFMSLSVVGWMVDVNNTSLIDGLLADEIVPVCLRIMETGVELTKTVAAFILERILLNDIGLDYICATQDRFYAVNGAFATVVQKQCSPRLLKYILGCYLCLSNHPLACQALRRCLPTFHPGAFDEITGNMLHQLYDRLSPWCLR